jgi:hypothetical protein
VAVWQPICVIGDQTTTIQKEAVMKKRIAQFFVVVLFVRLSIGCATIIHGSSQDINISSAPDQADVWIDGARMGTTPTKVTLKRKNDYLVTVKKEGYKEATVKIEGATSAWIIGNVIFGGIIGCGIDFITGGAYDLKPERVDFNMTKLAELDGKTIHIDRAQLDQIKELRFIDDKGKAEVVIYINWVD